MYPGASCRSVRFSGARPRVLAVEDEPDIVAVVREVLAPEGYAVTAVDRVEAAAALLRTGGFDLVLCDGLSSDPRRAWQNALAVLAAAGATPVALFTAHAVAPDRATAAGFRAVLRKPFDLDALLDLVRALTG